MSKAEHFDARKYFLATARWFGAWPDRAIRQFEAEGFTRIRLERVDPHPVYHLHMRAPAASLTSRQARRLIRKVVEQVGTIPRDAFFCSADRQGRIEASFILEF